MKSLSNRLGKISGVSLTLFLVFFASGVFSQITAPTAQDAFLTEYNDYDNATQQWTLMPPAEQDSVFIFCGDVGSLVAPDPGCSYQWMIYNSTTQLFENMGGAGSTNQIIYNLISGGYRVLTMCAGDTSCYDAWVFANETVIDAYIEETATGVQGNEVVGCEPFELHGSADPMSDMTVYNPPPTNFVVGPTTQIEVCFSGDHTWVSDLGFYLVSPDPPLPSAPVVELLPSVAAWDNVTSLNSNILGCSSGLNTNCNNGDNINQLCFTTAIPVSSASNVTSPCVCDVATPLTGTWGSAGPWTNAYGYDAGQGGWAVQIYDCIGADVGHLSEASITFTDQAQCGTSTIYYNSGPISSDINDMSCDAASASIYVVPLSQPYSYNIPNSITTNGWYRCDGTPLSTPLEDDEYFTAGNIPTATTCYIYQATDNLGCTTSDTVVFTTSPTDPTITPEPDMCSTDSVIILDAADGGGVWSPQPLVTSAGIFDPATANIGPGGNLITYSISGPCADSDQITIIVNEAPEVTSLIDSCDDANPTQYFVNFEYSGGIAPYEITNVAAGDSAGTTANGSFVSFPIQSGVPYEIEIDNLDGCGTITVVGEMICDCGTHSGTMDLSPITVCQGNPITATHLEDSVLNPDDIFGFIIHDGSGSYPFTAMDYSSTPTFNDNFPGFQYGTTYYISAVAGFADSVGAPVDWQVDPADSCYSQSMGTPVLWLQSPAAVIDLDNDRICGKTIELFADTPMVGNGSWECPTCVDYVAVNATTYTDPAIWVTLADDYGFETFVWTVFNGTCSAQDSIVVEFAQSPTAYAGGDKEVCGLSTDMEAVMDLPPGAGYGEWSGPVGTGFDTINSVTSPVFISNYGTYTFTWTEYNGFGGNACPDEDYVNITFIPQPEPFIGDDDTVCGTNYTLQAANILEGNTLWEWTSTADVGIIPYLATPDSATTSVQVTGFTNSTTVEFVFWEKNLNSVSPVCEMHDTINITFFATPYSFPGNDATVCGSTYQLDADDGLPGVWTVDLVNAVFDTSDIVIDSIGTGSDEGMEDPKAFVSLTSLGAFGDSCEVTVPFDWVVSNNTCKDVATVYITFRQQPEAQAGVDRTVCGYSHEFQSDKSLACNPVTQWVVYDGPTTNGITYVPNNATDTNTTVTVPQYGIYDFIWTETHPNMNTCKDRDTVEVTFIANPTAEAGDPFYVCGEITNLPAIPSPGAFGAWSPVPGVEYVNINDANTEVDIHGNYDTLSFEWCETIGGCMDCDSVSIAFFQDIVSTQVTYIPTEFEDSIMPNCGRIFPNLSSLGTGGVSTADGYWLDAISADQDFYDVQQSPINNDTIDVNNQWGVHTIYWVVRNGINFDGSAVCIDSSEAIKINFIERPTPDAGEDIIECGLVAELNAVDNGFWGQWSSNYSASVFHFDGLIRDTLPNDSVTVSVYSYDQTPDYYEYYWQEDSGHDIPQFECSEKDTVLVYFVKKPSALFHHYRPQCYGYTAEIWADLQDPALVDPATAEFVWDWSEDVDSILCADTNCTGPGPHHISWNIDPNAPDEVYRYITLQVINEYGCRSNTYDSIILEPQAADPYIVISDATCHEDNGSIDLSLDTTGLYTFSWDPLDGRIANVDDLNPTGLAASDTIPYHLTVVYEAEDQQNCPECRCVETFDLTIEDVGNVVAGIDTSDFVWFDGIAAYDSISIAEIDLIDYSTADAFKWRWRIFDESNGHIQVSFLNEDMEEVDEVTDIMTTIYITDPGIYSIELRAESREGCFDFATYYTFFVKAESSITMPNIFTPNGDEWNEVFGPYCETMESIHGIILNRWGRKIYEWNWAADGSADEINGWDGKIGGSRDAAPGVYFCIYEGVGMDGVTYEPKETVFYLVREK